MLVVRQSGSPTVWLDGIPECLDPRGYVFMPSWDNTFVPFCENVLLPPGSDVKVPLRLYEGKDGSGGLDRTVEIRFRTFDRGCDVWVSNEGLEGRENIGVEDDPPVFRETATDG